MNASSLAPSPGRGDASRVMGRSNTQNNEASLIGGVVGLAQFLGTGAAAGSYLASADAVQAGGAPAVAPGLGLANATGRTAGEGGVARHDLPASNNGSVASTPVADVKDGPGAVASSGGASAIASQQTVSPAPAAIDHGQHAGGQGSVGTGSAPANGGVAQTESTPEQVSPIDPGPQASPMPITGAFAEFMQSNISSSDNGATSISTAITYIHSITNSIVFLGDNVAFANALNFAPVTQLNQFAGGGSSVSAAGQMSNAAITDNDATAVAIAATVINYAYNSIIVTGSSIAEATALNLSPVTQVNQTLFSNLDAPYFGTLDQANLAMTDNDSTALAQAGLLIGHAGAGATPGGVPAGETYQPNFDALENQHAWSDFELV